MEFTEIKKKIDRLGVGLKIRSATKRGSNLLDKTLEKGLLNKHGIDLLTENPAVLAVFKMDMELAANRTQGNEDKGLQERADKAKEKLSLGQLMALLQLEGKKLDEGLKKLGV